MFYNSSLFLLFLLNWRLLFLLLWVILIWTLFQSLGSFCYSNWQFFLFHLIIRFRYSIILILLLLLFPIKSVWGLIFRDWLQRLFRVWLLKSTLFWSVNLTANVLLWVHIIALMKWFLNRWIDVLTPRNVHNVGLWVRHACIVSHYFALNWLFNAGRSFLLDWNLSSFLLFPHVIIPYRILLLLFRPQHG